MILSFLERLEEHLERLKLVLERLSMFDLKVNLPKCSILQNEVKYLWHVVTCEWIKQNPEKIEGIKNYPIPKWVKEIIGLL